MIVTIWRHGEAGSAPSDKQRELTDKGFDDVGFGCRQFHHALEARGMPSPDLLLYSPWVRTRETADIIASAFTHAPSRELEALRPGSSVQRVESALVQLAKPEANPDSDTLLPTHVVLVSHQPLVSQLVDYFMDTAGAVPPLSPGAFVTFELSTPARACGELRFWAVPPEYQAGV
ncbi:MAG: hypothetical protein H6985_20175 [Pseudomonadales bacterium]|nr:hypothetical protein [Halioglobus sp.]MCP5131887.1 hypothetical protein [Pseudomonadales bacterium]